jgi:sec-independent protein translocase protein TatA
MLGTGEIIVILCLVLLLFGGKKLPEFARNLGRGIREFKQACSGEDIDSSKMPIQPDLIENQHIKDKEKDSDHG